MATFGEIRYRVSKEVPGVDLDLIDGYIGDRYNAILDRLAWSRLSVDYVIQTVAPYSTGTLSLTEGETSVAIAGGTFDDTMTGAVLRVEGRDEYYEFSYTDAATGALDRYFEGPTGTYGFQLLVTVFDLPDDVRIVENCRLLTASSPMGRLNKHDLDLAAPQRLATGVPQLWSPAPDTDTDPPAMQVELYPAPDKVYSVVVACVVEGPTLDGTSVSLLPWLRPSALVSGVKADCYNYLEKFGAADRQERKFEDYIGDMVRTEAINRGPQKVRQASWLTRHNIERAMRSARNRTGPRLP